MSILPRLIALYRAAGHEPVTGYNPFHFENYMDAPFTRFVANKALTGCAGLALQEVMFLEHFHTYLSPRNILVIGNAHGWSTIALALIFPSATVVGIDPDPSGNGLTNQIAQAASLNARAIEGASPQDVGRICSAQFAGSVDLVLIDAIHTNEAVLADFAACQAFAGDNTIYVLHDVLNWHLVDAIHKIKADHAMQGEVLTRTASGMAVLWRSAPPSFRDYIGAFHEPPDLFRAVRRVLLSDFARSVSPVIERL